MARIGYIRVSNNDQNLSRQVERLEKICSKVFSDKIRGKDTDRPELRKMLDYIREDDIVVIAELDRLGRNNKDLTDLINQIQNKGATLEILDFPSLTGIEDENLRRLMNNLILEIYKYQAESERKKSRSPSAKGNLRGENGYSKKMMSAYSSLLNYTKVA